MHFVYDGINSKNMGIINAILEPGLMEEPFLPSATLHETHTRHNNTPYFNKIKREPLVFNLVCAFEEGLSENKIRQVRRWLAKGSYKELYFCNEPNKRYFAMYEESSLSHTGLDGYFEITFRTNSPYAHSNLIETGIYNQVSPTFTFTRPSPAIHPETGEEVPADTPIFMSFAEDKRGLLMEEGTENLLAVNMLKFENGSVGAGVDIIITQGQSVPEWGTNEATRIQTFGGSTSTKYSFPVGYISELNQEYTGSVYLKNIGINTIMLDINPGGNILVLPEEAIRATVSGVGNDISWLSLRIRAVNIGDSLDLIAWQPQIEQKPYPTSFTVGTRANPTSLLTLPEALPEEFGIGISAKMLHAHGIKSRTFWQAGDYHRLFYDMADSKIKMQYGGAIAETSPVSWSADDIIGVYGGKKDGKLFVQAKVAGELGEKTAVEVGGRNLLRNSKGPWANANYGLRSFPFGDAIPAAGEIYTVTMKYTVGADRDKLAVYSSGGYRHLVVFYETDKNELGIASKTFTMSYADGRTPAEGFDYLSVYQFPSDGTSESTIEWIKLERGNKPTDWTPAPEDGDTTELYVGSLSDEGETPNAVLADFTLHDSGDIDPEGYLSQVPGGGV